MRSLVQVQDGPPPTESLRKEVIIDLLSRSVVTEKMRGGIAQLVERLLCKQDVSGSSPLTSTKEKENSALSLLIDEDAGLYQV